MGCGLLSLVGRERNFPLKRVLVANGRRTYVACYRDGVRGVDCQKGRFTWWAGDDAADYDWRGGRRRSNNGQMTDRAVGYFYSTPE